MTSLTLATGQVPGRPKVGIIGLGRMGSAAARQLGPRFDCVGWDVREVSVPGVGFAGSLAEVARHADVIIGFLPSANETLAVVRDEGFRSAFEGSQAVFADASTSSPAEIRSLAVELGDAGDRILDTPILGRPESAGSWTMPVGGQVQAFETARPALEALASRIFHVGGLGSGHSIKLLNNMMFAAINVITAEAIGSCDRLGVDPASFVDIVGGSTAATVSPLFRSLAPRMLGEQLETVFTVALLDKDLRLALAMCEAAGVPLVSAPALQQVTSAARARGLGDRDSAALVELYAVRSGNGQ